MHYFKLLTAFALGAGVWSNSAFAKELRWTHYGVRPLAMGNAYVAVADDYNALFYNPAGLARLDTWHGELINPSFGISESTITAIEDFSKLATSKSSGVDATLDAFESMTGKSQWINLGLTPHLVFPGFGLGVGLDIGGSLLIHRSTVSADLDAGVNAIVPIAFAKSFFEERLSLGLTIKGVFKQGVERDFSLADITAFSNKSTDSTGKALKDYFVGGKGVGVDVGLLFTPVEVGEPTLGITVADLGGTPYAPANVGSMEFGTPRSREPVLNAGISFKPVKSGGYYVLTSMDVHAINQPIHFSKKLNFGAEWGLSSVLKLQAGLHQGSLGGGFQLDAWLLVMRFATYTEQVGRVAGESIASNSRRYVAQFKILL